jgi:hypothetical protein
LTVFFRACRRRNSLKVPLKTAEIGPGEKLETKPNSRRTSKEADVEVGSSGSDGGEVDRSLPSLFSPAARAKSVMDVIPASILFNMTFCFPPPPTGFELADLTHPASTPTLPHLSLIVSLDSVTFVLFEAAALRRCQTMEWAS